MNIGKISLCRGCGAKIAWIVTRKGYKMPIDVAPKRVFTYIDKIKQWEQVAGHESHFATCPKAGEFRQ